MPRGAAFIVNVIKSGGKMLQEHPVAAVVHCGADIVIDTQRQWLAAAGSAHGNDGGRALWHGHWRRYHHVTTGKLLQEQPTAAAAAAVPHDAVNVVDAIK